MSPTNGFRPRASKNCGNCRAVKRRCDQQRPQCGQCIRSRESCTGYRDDWELVFRDQTTHTIKQSRKKYAKKASSTETSQSPPTRVLGPSLDEMGVNYFLKDFVCGGRSPSRGYLNYIPTVYSPDAEHPTLSTSMAAVGLVALASQQPELIRHARAKYSEAIHRVNNALASPDEALKDSTLMSVISLGVFEHVSNYESWVRHVKGAAALVVARGKAQFTTPNSILLFNQVRADMSAACVQAIQPFPEDMRELQEEATKHVDTSSAFWLIGVLATRCNTLFADVTKNNQIVPESEFIPWPYFLQEAIALEADFQDVLALLAIQEPYTTTVQPCGDTDYMIYNGRYDIYETSWAIRIWNNSRLLEIIVCEVVCWLINKILLRELLQPDQAIKLKLKLQDSLQIMSMRGQEILASVPQGLGYISVSESPSHADSCSNASVSGGYMMTWSLYTVGRSPVVDDATREWIIKQLETISKSAGVAMALQLSQDMAKVDLRGD